MNYSIIMPYYDRPIQLHNTLKSFEYHYADRTDWEVIIVEDVKCKQDEELESICKEFEELPIIWNFSGRDDEWNPVRLYNRAVQTAWGKRLVISGPEIFHLSNVLGALDGKWEDAYVVAACVASDRPPIKCDHASAFDFRYDRWLQHTEFRNSQYYFCACISRSNWLRIGGMDEAYAEGVGFEDLDFLKRVKSTGVDVVCLDEIVTVHQKHPTWKEYVTEDRATRNALVRRNRLLYAVKWNNGVVVKTVHHKKGDC